jgi:hypothetical protein
MLSQRLKWKGCQKAQREMGGSVDSAPACYGSWNADISQKYNIGDKAKEWPAHSILPKKYTKKKEGTKIVWE